MSVTAVTAFVASRCLSGTKITFQGRGCREDAVHPWLWPWGNQRVKTHRTEHPGATWEKENEQKGEMGAERQVGPPPLGKATVGGVTCVPKCESVSQCPDSEQQELTIWDPGELVGTFGAFRVEKAFFVNAFLIIYMRFS